MYLSYYSTVTFNFDQRGRSSRFVNRLCPSTRLSSRKKLQFKSVFGKAPRCVITRIVGTRVYWRAATGKHLPDPQTFSIIGLVSIAESQRLVRYYGFRTRMAATSLDVFIHNSFPVLFFALLNFNPGTPHWDLSRLTMRSPYILNI